MNVEDFREAGNDLYHRLHLPTYPVAVKFIQTDDEIPEGVLRPAAIGQKWSLCQAYTYARRFGWHTAITADDNFCVPASAMHGWIDVTEKEFIESQIRQGWHKDARAEKNRYRAVMRLFEGPDGESLQDKAGRYRGFISSPLSHTIIEPDTVLVFGNGAHITHIIHSLCYDYTTPVISSFEGFEETCVKGGILPFITGQPQVVIPGMGDRAFAGISDDEIAIGVPASLLERIVQDLFKTGGDMNIGQPVKSMVVSGITESITPGFQYLREVVDKKTNS